jgi:hypothetical protein
MGTNTKVSSLNWISTRKTYSQGHNLIKYINYILVSQCMKLSTNINSGLAGLNTLVKYYEYNTLETYYVYNTLEKYWLKFCKMVPAFQYNKINLMGNSCKKGSWYLSWDWNKNNLFLYLGNNPISHVLSFLRCNFIIIRYFYLPLLLLYWLQSWIVLFTL